MKGGGALPNYELEIYGISFPFANIMKVGMLHEQVGLANLRKIKNAGNAQKIWELPAFI
ncbi:MAG: hypothetical protein R3C26_04750 [Calditrichia bacterium]